MNRGRVNAERPTLLRGSVTYTMILQHLNTGNVCPRSRTDIKQEFEFYIDNITDPDIQAVFRDVNFDIDGDFLVDGGNPSRITGTTDKGSG